MPSKKPIYKKEYEPVNSVDEKLCSSKSRLALVLELTSRPWSKRMFGRCCSGSRCGLPARGPSPGKPRVRSNCMNSQKTHSAKSTKSAPKKSAPINDMPARAP